MDFLDIHDQGTTTVQRRVISLNRDWFFQQGNDPAFEPRQAQRLPTNVHLDLMLHEILSDPFVGKNEEECQRVGMVPWVYRLFFPSPHVSTEKVVLAFDGLDTYATVTLNNEQILKTENMFIPERVDVTRLLVCKGQNTLEIEFASAYLTGKRLIEKYPDHHWGCWNGDPSRLAVRKAQYHYVNQT